MASGHDFGTLVTRESVEDLFRWIIRLEQAQTVSLLKRNHLENEGSGQGIHLQDIHSLSMLHHGKGVGLKDRLNMRHNIS